MALRTAEEISGSLKEILGEQSPEGLLELLEDIADSVGQSSGISKSDYENAVSERDAYKEKYDDLRSRYINRFYGGYDKENEKGFINASAAESAIINSEEDETDPYSELFE